MAADPRATHAEPAAAEPLDAPTPLLGGLSPRDFMRRHWQARPRLVRGAVDPASAALDARTLFALAAEDDVESRLVMREGEGAGARWRLRHGPFTRRRLPPVATPGWSLLVQGVDLHHEPVHRLLRRFRFTPDARLDDAMVSFASPGGGVGPHLDSYDVFLVQLAGHRQWRIAPPPRGRAAALRDDVPLRMLARLDPRETWTLAPGDLLYLPPGWAHDGVAVDGPCITCSIGFRAPAAGELAGELLSRLGEGLELPAWPRFADRGREATRTPARIPADLARYADAVLRAALADRGARRAALGAWLSEPKPGTWFERGDPWPAGAGVALDRRTRMLYDAQALHVNGETHRLDVPGPAAARALRRLADRRKLTRDDVRAAGAGLPALLAAWCEAGWCHPLDDDHDVA